MIKIKNDSKKLAEDMVDGYLSAYPQYFVKVPEVNGFMMKDRKDKVAVVIGGGSGCEPLYSGFVGFGLADGTAVGNPFAAPSAYSIYEVTKHVHMGKGVLFVTGNHPGDVLNFDMAAEMCELDGIKAKTVAVWDDIASAPLESKEERLGVAGIVMAIKVAGGASELGYDLNEVERITKKARASLKTLSAVTSPCILPDTEKLMFSDLEEGTIEIGMGFNGEPGLNSLKTNNADEIVSKMMEYLLDDLKPEKNDEVCVLINSLGATSLMELFVINKSVSKILYNNDIKVYRTDVNRFFSPQEMGGFSITIMNLDDELKKCYGHPSYSPFFSTI